jgi:GDP-L-fucose synthase
MQNFINLGYGTDITIKEFVEIAMNALDFDGEIVYDDTKPDGTMNKVTNNSKALSLGWKPKTELLDGLRKTYEWFVSSNYVNNIEK